jgi:restriction endonuclease Mrr
VIHRDKQWEKEIYQKAKAFAVELISQAGRPVPFSEICSRIKEKYPKLCDDSVQDPWAPSQPYWKHRVASALQTLKHRSIDQTSQGWMWRAGEQREAQPRATKDDEDIDHGDEELTHGSLNEAVVHVLKGLSPKGFQTFIIERLLPCLGLTSVSVRQFVRDGGIDGEGVLEISEETIIAGVTEKSSRKVRCGVQVKRWGSTVSRPEVQTFRGAISGHLDRGLYKTSNFSRDAVDEARRSGVVPITIIDGATLSALLIDRGLGIKDITIRVVDRDFFASYQE